MIENYYLSGDGQILVEKIPGKNSKNYGVVDLFPKRKNSMKFQRISSFKEKPKVIKSKFTHRIIGRYILPYEIMSFLSKAAPSKNGEIQLTNSLQELITSDINLNAMVSFSDVFDCGSIDGFIRANVALASKDPKMKKLLKEILN